MTPFVGFVNNKMKAATFLDGLLFDERRYDALTVTNRRMPSGTIMERYTPESMTADTMIMPLPRNTIKTPIITMRATRN
jgi:hypothetical protein